jgi:hypothetical protein
MFFDIIKLFKERFNIDMSNWKVEVFHYVGSDNIEYHNYFDNPFHEDINDGLIVPELIPVSKYGEELTEKQNGKI